MKFQIGDVVVLVSHDEGPFMTVYDIDVLLVRTCWFDIDAHLQYAAFSPDILVPG